MKIYVTTLAVGLLIGVIYSLLNVRSPAPPVVALIGLLGILAGEQVVPVAKRLFSGEGLSLGWLKSECGDHVFGALPTGSRAAGDRCTDPAESGS